MQEHTPPTLTKAAKQIVLPPYGALYLLHYSRPSMRGPTGKWRGCATIQPTAKNSAHSPSRGRLHWRLCHSPFGIRLFRRLIPFFLAQFWYFRYVVLAEGGESTCMQDDHAVRRSSTFPDATLLK
jgi:hypothetical protein